MLSHVDRITADLFDLHDKLDQCSDSSLRKLIEAWIEAKNKLLALLKGGISVQSEQD
jgi:hypothetical protein